MTVAFFDLDKTICAVPTEQRLTKHMLKNGLLSIKDVLAVLWGFVKYNLHLISDYDSFRKQIVQTTMKKVPVLDFEMTMQNAFENDLRPKIFPEVMKRINDHKKINHRIVIVSAALDKIVEVFAREIGADYHYATNLEVADEKFSGKVLGNVYYGKRKKDAVLQYCKKHKIDPAKCYAYGDYYEDRHMMEVVGNPVAINPDKKLLNVAKERNWKIIDAFVCTID